MKSSGNEITVTITDRSVHNQYCTFSRNGIQIFIFYWTSGNSFTINIDDLNKGTYVFSITAYDGIGGVSTENITVIVRNKIRVGILIPLIMVPSTFAIFGAIFLYFRYFKKK
jgi:hypothetical protein